MAELEENTTSALTVLVPISVSPAEVPVARAMLVTDLYIFSLDTIKLAVAAIVIVSERAEPSWPTPVIVYVAADADVCFTST